MNSPEAPHELASAAERFAEHLRDHPEAASSHPAALAEEFGLPETFVRSVVFQLRAPPSGDSPLRIALQDTWRKFRAMVGAGVQLFVDVTNQPMAFLIATTVVLNVAFLVLGLFGEGFRFDSFGKGIQLQLAQVGGVTLLVGALVHVTVYARAGRSGLALRGTSAVVAISAIPIAISVGRYASPSDPNRAFYVLTLVCSLALGFVYGIGALLASVIGGAYSMRRDETELDALGRSELLDRLMQVRERLTEWDGKPGSRRALAKSRLKWFRQNWLPGAVVLALGFGLLNVGVISGFYQGHPVENTPVTGARILVSFSFSILSTAVLILVGLLAGTIRRGIVASLVALVVMTAVEFLPTGTFGPAIAWRSVQGANFLIQILFTAILGGLAGLGARIEEHARRMRLAQDNDPASNVAEWVRIQWRLTPKRQSVCVLVVDAKASALMKSQADPLVAEWSFRAYQQFIETTCKRWSGAVHDTTGDGAVVAFPTPNDAFAAARAIQSEIGHFNKSTNRLAMPFRLRIGLHVGVIQGELDEVEFTEVIDIAAHVERVSPVGGIALTKPVAESLESEALASLRDLVDGYEVFVALNPTG